jgi:hypothetical protein
VERKGIGTSSIAVRIDEPHHPYQLGELRPRPEEQTGYPRVVEVFPAELGL